MKKRRSIGLLVLAVFAVLGIVWGFLPRPIPVDTSPVVRGALQVTVEQEGKTRVVDRYVVSAPVNASARRIELDVGDEVKRGQSLLELAPVGSAVLDARSRAQAQARVAAAEAALEESRQALDASVADADFARGELKRLQQLYETGAVSKGVLDQGESASRRAEAVRRSAMFAVDVARFEVEAARTALRYSVAEYSDKPTETVIVESPVDGRVLKVYHESAGVVVAGEQLIEVGDPRSLEVEVDVLSKDAVRIAPAMRVLLERWGGDAPLEGVVRVVEPVGFTKISALGVEEQRVWVIVDFVSPREDWERLGDGYRVEARFILWEGTDVLQVPSSALFRVGDAWAVFVAETEEGVARLRKVQLGRRSALRVEVRSGLEPGERVIPHPNDQVEDGVAVETQTRE